MVDTAVATYKRRKEQSSRWSADISAAGRDIGPPPPCQNPVRRLAAKRALAIHCQTYHADVFYLPWSPDQLDVIRDIEQIIVSGGQMAVTMPRGSGKTAIIVKAVEWAILNGYRYFALLIAATEKKAEQLLATIKTDLARNDRLLADYPEVCHPIRALEGIAHRCNGQLCNGQPTTMRWTSDELILPTIAGSPASAGVFRVAGLTGDIRGLQFADPTSGQIRRPDIIMADALLALFVPALTKGKKAKAPKAA